jgi:[acyl-carrier-protein] S-malonyltransferase
VETVLEFGKQGITHNVECAPGKVLAGLNKRIDVNQQSLAINDGAALKSALSILK